MNELIVFRNENMKLKGINKNGTPMFDVESVGRCLGFTQLKNRKEYVKYERMAGYLCSPFLGKGDLITEPQVYQLMFKAKNEIAQRFQNWLAFEVLPQIRGTGGYIPINKKMTENEIMARALQISQNTLNKKDEIIEMQKPKVEAYNKFLDTKNLLSWNDVAKNLGIGRNNMLKELRALHILMKNNTPYQRYMKYFKVKFDVNGIYKNPITLVNSKGQEFIRKLLAEDMLSA